MSFLALFRRFEAFKAFSDSGIGRCGVRRFKGINILVYKVLIIKCLAFFPFFAPVFAQRSNHACIQSLLKDELMSPDKSFRKVESYLELQDLAWINFDSTSSQDLLIENPLVEFGRLSGDSLIRTIEVNVDYLVQDSVVRAVGKVYKDTISVKDFRKVLKGALPEERGTDPRSFARYWFPAIAVFTGVAGIIALFYVRSR